MFSIGEFARLGAVSIRALRHYDPSWAKLVRKRAERSLLAVVSVVLLGPAAVMVCQPT